MLPPGILYHGTGEKYAAAIRQQGILHKNRLYVHLSFNRETAEKVGSRHGRPVIFQVDTAAMWCDGFHFFESVNHVWLTGHVPAKYLKKL